MSFRGKTILITGASSGLGAAMARELGRRGANLVLAARRADRLQAVANELRHSGEVISVVADVTQDEDVARIVQTAKRKFGRLDVVIANAGFGVTGRFENLNLSDYRRQLETNLFGVIRTARAAAEDLKDTRGRLLIIGSLNGLVASREASPYVVSKFAVRGLAEALYLELAPFGVSVTHAVPGFVTTEFRWEGHQGVVSPTRSASFLSLSAERAACVIIAALERRKREVIVSAHGKGIAWVSRHFPFFFYWLLPKVRSGARARSWRRAPLLDR